MRPENAPDIDDAAAVCGEYTKIQWKKNHTIEKTNSGGQFISFIKR
jgi:hypothetical protein